jgi:hypothetical protein
MRFLKILFKLILSITVLVFIAYGAFRVKEYYVGRNYVDYLKSNSESVNLEEEFSYEIASKDISDYPLILVGEIHGFEVPTKFDVEFFSHLHSNFNVNSYLLEMDHSQAYFMNKYNETGEIELLDKVLENWVVRAGRNNLDYRDRWVNLRKVFMSRPFTYYGNNNISDYLLLTEHINTLSGEQRTVLKETLSDSLKLIQAKSTLESLLSKVDLENDSTDLSWNYQHLLKNVNYQLNNKYREEVLTENLAELYNHYQLKEQKVYGWYGIGHTLLDTFKSDYQPMASRIMELDPWFENKILSFNFIFCDSYMVMPSKSLPGILQDEGEYTRMPVSYDNIWLSYMYGIEDIKRITEKNTKTIIKLNDVDSPYIGNNRLFSMFKLLPVGQVINAKEGGSAIDYGQFVIFVRNSDWAEPDH